LQNFNTCTETSGHKELKACVQIPCIMLLKQNGHKPTSYGKNMSA